MRLPTARPGEHSTAQETCSPQPPSHMQALAKATRLQKSSWLVNNMLQQACGMQEAALRTQTRLHHSISFCRHRPGQGLQVPAVEAANIQPFIFTEQIFQEYFHAWEQVAHRLDAFASLQVLSCPGHDAEL